LAPAAFATLLRVRGIGFVSLQHDDEGAGAGEIAAHAGVPVRVFPEAHADLDDTAALVSSLDCVLTVCSTVVHLAGALGTPTLVLTPAWPEWRYLREGASLPWYPSVRLLRQRVPGDWAPVIDEAREALLRLASGGDCWTGGGDAPADDEMSKDS
jgi:ADP-heptose:LPS heptosyltransferase